MWRAVGFIALLLVLPAAAQDKPTEASPLAETSPPVAPPPAAAAPAVEPAKVRVPNDAQNSICLLVESAARAHSLPVEFFARVIWQESRFRADAVGPVTRNGQRALGIAQFMPGTAAERNLLNPLDPIQALPKSAEFLKELHRDFGNLGLAAAAYNAGPRRIRDWMAGTGPMPAETRNYVSAITGVSVDQWAKAAPDADRKIEPGPSCGELVALLKRAPNTFVAALEQRVVVGAMRPWGVILGADMNRGKIMYRYALLQQRHSAALANRDPILIERPPGPLPRYSVRVGADTRMEANELCNQIHKSGGDCAVLRNSRG
jgi:hypothetical protein